MKNEVRPIDANALKLKIREYMSDYKGSPTRLAVCRAVLSMLGDEGQTPTLTDHFRGQTKRAQQDTAWISVKERLPEKQADVLMLFDHNMAVGFWYDTDEDTTFWCAYTDDGFYTDCDVEPTRWMPLPEPPEED